MKPKHTYFAKMFLLTGIPFAALMTITNVAYGEEFVLWQFLFYLIFFGLFMGLFLTNAMTSKLKKLGIEDGTIDDLKAFQKRSITSKLSIENAYQKIENDPFFRKATFSFDGSLLIIKKGISSFSWGEKITIKLLLEFEDSFKYEITSQPMVIFNIMEGAKNYENVLKIQEILSSQ